MDFRAACEELLGIVDAVAETGRSSFLTANSCGPEGRYEVVAKFKTMEEMQAFYRSLVELGKVAVAT